jgi:hypothetical protein
LFSGWPIVNREGHLIAIAIEIDFEHTVDRLADGGEFVERGPEIARAVGDEDEIAIASVARDIPVPPARAAKYAQGAVLLAALRGDGDQADADAFVNQKAYDTAIASSRRRPRRTGCRSHHGSLRRGPRSG